MRLSHVITLAALASATSSGVADFTGAYELQHWTSTGISEGTTAISPVSGYSPIAEFSYDVNLGNFGFGVSPRTTSFEAVADRSGTVCFDWTWEGYHAWCCPATATLQVYALSPDGTTTFTLVNEWVSGPFSFTGSASIDVTEGWTFGIMVGGSNMDSDSVLQGSVTVSNFSTPLAAEGDYAMEHWSSSGIAEGSTFISPLSGPATRPEFSYDVNLGDPGEGVSWRTTDFSVVAQADGEVAFDWTYEGFHAFFQTTATLVVFAETSLGTVQQVLVNTDTFGEFAFSGRASIQAEKGKRFGITVGGANYDSNSRLYGTVTLSKVHAPVSFDNAYQLQNWSDSGIDEGVTAIEPSSGPSPHASVLYDVFLGDPGLGVPHRTVEFSVIADTDGTASFDWLYEGFHAYFLADATLQVFSESCLGRQVSEELYTSVSGDFSFSGSSSIDVYEGHRFGIIVGGSNFDSNSRLTGEATLTSLCVEPRTCPADMNDSGNINVFDFLSFQTYYSEGNPRADLAAPCGILNVFDFLTFQTLFSDGC